MLLATSDHIEGLPVFPLDLARTESWIYDRLSLYILRRLLLMFLLALMPHSTKVFVIVRYVALAGQM